MRNLIVLGASNVSLALPHLWHGVRQSTEQATRLVVVAGHGRSYGLPSTVLGRTLPSILQSKCWETLEHFVPKEAPLEAIITDIGNDIVYGVSASVLGCWIQECVDRLRRWPVRLTMTELPLVSLSRMSRSRFLLFRSLLFPQSTLEFQDALGIGAAVNSIVRSIARDVDARLVAPARDWYGIDPIHIRGSLRRFAWSQICPLIPDAPPLPPPTPFDTWRLWRQRPALMWRGKRQLEQAQPVLGDRLAQLWLY